MTSYYFPFGNSNAAVTQSINYSLFATTASAAQSVTIPVTTALFATSVQITPPAGSSGSSMNINSCSGTPASGSQGPSGARGPVGLDASGCPPGTIPCPALITSLSLYINPSRPSGSQFNLVCMELGGCISSSVGCPDALPISSNSGSIPTIP